MYVMKVACVAKHSDDRSYASPSTDETPETDDPSARGRYGGPPVSEPAANPCGQMGEPSLNDALSRHKRIPYRHLERGMFVTMSPGVDTRPTEICGEARYYIQSARFGVIMSKETRKGEARWPDVTGTERDQAPWNPRTRNPCQMTITSCRKGNACGTQA